nr:hypothetical protein GCM10025699_13190 [Microbacterium flavescens]
MRPRVSMADVAAVAGVSGQTVSRVVNDSPRVDPATRARVESAMAQLGYRPHRAARALRTGRTQTLGLLVSTLATVGNSRMLQAVADAAATRGYALTVVTLGAHPDVSSAFERLSDQGVDGVMVLNEATAAARDAPAPAGLRVVVVDTLPEPEGSGVSASSSPTTPAAPAPRPSTSCHSGIAPSTTSEVRRRRSRHPSGNAAGARRSRPPMHRSRRSCAATGPRRPATPPRPDSWATPRPRCSPPTTSSRWGRSARSPTRDARCPAT